MKYEYKKVKGYEQKKFTENGHTMFEEDVLQRLKRLAYLEEQLKQANGADKSASNCNMPRIMPGFCDDEEDECLDQEEPDYKECMCCGNVQQSGMSCDKCTGPTRDRFL